VPWPLAFIYPRWSVDAGAIHPYLFPAAFLAVVAALLVLARRIGRGPAAAVLFFAGTLVPALGFFDVYPMRYAYVADHFQYLASMGLIALGCGLAAAWAARTGPRSIPPRTSSAPWARAVAAVVLVVLGILTWRQCGAYHDAETLWRDTIAKNPDAWMARDNLALILAARGETDAAIAQYREAVRINPREASVRSNLGMALAGKGDAAGAVEEFSRALEIDPDLVEVRYNLGTALLRTGDFSSAVAAFEEVVRRSPRYAQAHNNLAMALRRVGREDEAIAHYQQALTIDPHLSAASFNLAAALDAQGRLEEAAAAYAEFLKLQPRDAEAESRYADVLTDLGRADEAAVHARRARELSGGAGAAARTTPGAP
jgi:tetratricopeptide (TPR) repeat protein